MSEQNSVIVGSMGGINIDATRANAIAANAWCVEELAAISEIENPEQLPGRLQTVVTTYAHIFEAMDYLSRLTPAHHPAGAKKKKRLDVSSPKRRRRRKKRGFVSILDLFDWGV